MIIDEVHLVVELLLSEECPCFTHNEEEQYSQYIINKLGLNED